MVSTAHPPLLRVRRFGRGNSPVQASQVVGLGATKLYVAIHPLQGGSAGEQAGELYRHLGAFLREQGAGPQDVITEKVFFSDLEAQFEDFGRERAAFYGPRAEPATTYLGQPPCRPGAWCELQARVIFANGADPLVVRPLHADLGQGTGRVVSYRDYDHFFLHNVTGEAGPFPVQAGQVFSRAAAALNQEELRFADTIRTWIYLPQMERDYAALNQVRSAFFARQGVQRLPASTGIEGGVWPAGRRMAMDLYTLRAARPVRIEQLHADTMNEAPAYGSAFSRGLAVTREDRKVVYISGTASIDEQGQVLHVGDIEGQAHRMLTNVEGLLESAGAGLSDVVRATTYLKRPEDCDCLTRVYARRGLPRDIPHTICRAAVCRPEWLCELEVAAIFDPAGR
jgi:enamine deaminase RidA (YjgF/YER057c/UK114 family)